MFGSKLKIRPALLERVQETTKQLGCTVEEFVEKSIERELDRVQAKPNRPQPTKAEVDDIVGKLKGLGYLE